MKKTKLRKHQIVSILLNILVIICMFFPLVSIDGQYFTILILLFNLSSFTLSPWLMIISISLFIFNISLNIREQLRANTGFQRRGELRLLNAPLLIIIVMVVQFSFYSQEYIVMACIPTFLAVIVLIGLEVITSILIPSYLESIEEAKAKKKATDLKEKETESTILSESNTTSKNNMREIYKLAWKNTKYSWRSLTLLFTSALLASILIFTSLALENLLQNFNTSSVWYLGYGMFETLKSTIIIIAALTILLMAISLEYYAIHRLYDYNLLVALGIRKKHLYLLIGLEYGGTLLLALLTGSALGVFFTNVLQRIILSTFSNITAVNVEWFKVFLLTFLICLGIYCFSAIINFEIFLEKDLNNRFGKIGERHDKLKFQEIFMAIGILLCIAGILSYTTVKLNEPIFGLLAFFLGLYFILRIVLFYILQSIKSGKNYIKTIFYLNDFYYRYKKNFNYMYILFIFHIIVLFYFVLQIATLYPFEDCEELYPYDYVCLGDETDNEYFEDISNEYQVEMTALEIVRFTVAGGDPTYVGGMGDIYLQGQNIGISASSYEYLTGETLSLSGNEVYAIMQQDISDSYHLLDWDGVSNDLDLHAGMPALYWWAERTSVFYDNYIIVESSRDTILGYFSYGYQENVVVFSDEAFSNLQTDAEESDLTGPTMLYLITTNDSNHEEVTSLMETYDELHPEYSSFTNVINNVYSTDILLQNTQSEFLMKLIIYLFLFIFFVFGAPYITISKTFTEMSELQNKNQLYRCMGMTYKVRCKTFFKTLYISSTLPLVFALFVSSGLLALVLNLRSITLEEWSVLRINILVLWAIYLLIQSLGIGVTRFIIQRKIIQS